MSTTDQHLKRIQEKVQQLLKQFAVLQKENNHFRDEFSKSRQITETQYKNIEVLKQQVNVLQLNAGAMSETDKKEMGKRIDTYLKEIDRCIASLSG